MNAKDLINWGELSRQLAGSRQTIRKNKIPKIHQPIIDELTKAIEQVLSKLPDKAKEWRKNKTDE